MVGEKESAPGVDIAEEMDTSDDAFEMDVNEESGLVDDVRVEGAPEEEDGPDVEVVERDDDDDVVTELDADEDPEEAADKELEGYSKNVKKRIAREINLRKEKEQEFEGFRRQATDYVGKLHNEGAVIVQREKALAEEYGKLQDAYAKLLDNSLEERHNSILKDLSSAKEALDVSAEVKLQSELETIRYQRRQLEETVKSLQGAKAARMADVQKGEQVFRPVAQPQEGAAPAAQQQAPAQPTLMGAQWKDGRKWYGRDGYEAETLYAHHVDQVLIKRGMNPNSKEFFATLDRELAKKFPALYRRKAGAATPVASVRSTTTTKSKGKVTLTRADLENMRRFGMNPNDPRQLKEYAAQKRG